MGEMYLRCSLWKHCGVPVLEIMEQFMKEGTVLMTKGKNQSMFKACRRKENITMLKKKEKKCTHIYIFLCPLSQYLFPQGFRI